MLKLKNVFSLRRATPQPSEADTHIIEEPSGPPRRADEKIMEEVENKYFACEMTSESIVSGLFASLPDDMNDGWLENAVYENERALEIVNSDLSARVLGSYNEFVEGMKRIHDVGVNLQQSGIICKNGRLSLKIARQELASGSLGMAAKYRKQQIYKGMIDTLTNVRQVNNCVHDLDAALHRGDYEVAINTYLEADRLAKTLTQTAGSLKCVEGIQRSIAGASSLLRSGLDESLRKTACVSFNPATYQALLRAYKALGRSYEVLNKLDEFFSVDLKDRVKRVLVKSIPNVLSASAIKLPRAFSEVPQHKFVECLLSILGGCTEVMWNFHAVKRWHDDSVMKANSQSSTTAAATPDTSSTADSASDKTLFVETRMGLERARKKLWDGMQTDVSDLLKHALLSQYQVEDALRVVEAVNLFIDIGREFSGKDSTALQNELKLRSTAYFEETKRSVTEDLRTMLENEQWTAVAAAIKVTDMKEFRNLQNSSTAGRMFSHWSNQRTFFTAQQPNTPESNPFYAAIKSISDPGYTIHTPGSGIPTVGDDDDDDDDDPELKDGHLADDDESIDVREQQTIVTNSAINIARKIGKYVTMCQVLGKPMATEIFRGICELYNCYLWAVWSGFIISTPSELGITKGMEAAAKVTTSVLQGIIQFRGPSSSSSDSSARKSIDGGSRKSVDGGSRPIATPQQQQQPQPAHVTQVWEIVAPERPETFMPPPLSARLDMNNPTNLYGLQHRLVATESLSFLKECMMLVKPTLRTNMPESRVVDQFYQHHVDTVDDFKLFMYRNLAKHLLPLPKIPELIRKFKWESASSTEDRPYVSQVAQQLSMLEMRLDGLRKQGCFPQKNKILVWESVILHVMDVLLEGYSSVKKCNSEGNALMTMDCQIIVSSMVRMSGLSPAPGAHITETYIKAFYVPEADFVEWCRQHQEYTGDMLLNLLGTCLFSGGLKRAQRSQMQTALEEIAKTRTVKRPLWQYVPVTEDLKRMRHKALAGGAQSPQPRLLRLTSAAYLNSSGNFSPSPPMQQQQQQQQPPVSPISAAPSRSSIDAQRRNSTSSSNPASATSTPRGSFDRPASERPSLGVPVSTPEKQQPSTTPPVAPQSPSNVLTL